MRSDLRQIVSGPDENHQPAAEGRAADSGPRVSSDLPVSAYLSRMEELAHMLSMRIGEGASALERIAELNQFLFGDLGFGPNTDDYYDPRNSFLNEVLERRTGIPITCR
jgi:regulator of sirC expression with transglutaminase-like and TPR domain